MSIQKPVSHNIAHRIVGGLTYLKLPYDTSARIEMHLISEISDVLHHNCVNCNNFEEKTEICTLAGKRPPAEVIAYGCSEFKDLIPF